MAKEKYKSAYIYLKEDYYRKPKELFGFLFDIIASRKRRSQPLTLLDAGCARGEFLYHAKNKGIFSRLVGVDYSQTLIEHAKSFEGLKGVDLHCGQAESFLLNEKFDVITFTGLLSFFDDIRIPLKNLKRHLKPGGQALITGIFNPFAVDVIVRYRNLNRGRKWEEGWNHISIKTIEQALDKLGMRLVKVHKFNLSIDLPQQEDTMRGWTVHLNGEKKFRIGVGFVYDILTLEVCHKKPVPGGKSLGKTI